MADHPLLTADILRSRVIYDPETGDFTWKMQPVPPGREKALLGWNTKYGGHKVRGFIHRHGHMQFGFGDFGAHIMAHRLAWLYVYGEWPNGHIDHINGNPSDNRIANLRLATRAENSRNCKMHKTNTSGVKGVFWNRRLKKWQCSISVNNRTIYIGIFNDINDASAARREAEDRYFGEFARRT